MNPSRVVAQRGFNATYSWRAKSCLIRSEVSGRNRESGSEGRTGNPAPKALRRTTFVASAEAAT